MAEDTNGAVSGLREPAAVSNPQPRNEPRRDPALGMSLANFLESDPGAGARPAPTRRVRAPAAASYPPDLLRRIQGATHIEAMLDAAEGSASPGVGAVLFARPGSPPRARPGGPWRAWVRAREQKLVPAPLWALLPVPTAPPPPSLAESMPDEARVQRILKAYRGAVKSVFGDVKETKIMLRGDVRNYCNFQAMSLAGRALVTFGIAPIAWALFSVDEWVDWQFGGHVEFAKVPPITVIFAASRIAQLRNKFAARSQSYGGGQAYFGPAFRELMERYAAMESRIPHSGIKTPEDARRYFLAHFPNTSWPELLGLARYEVEERKIYWRNAADAGDYVPEWLFRAAKKG